MAGAKAKAAGRKIFVLSAPSGGGKTTLAEKLLRSVPRLVRSISMTTRKPRSGEKNGRDYFFVSNSKFLSLKKKKGFLEDARVFGHRYGTPRSFVEQKLKSGRDVLLVIDVQGARQVRRAAREKSVLIFITPPSMRELRLRLVGRSTDTASVIRRRLQVARGEMKQRSKYDYVIENRSLSKAARDLVRVIRTERQKAKA